MRYQELENLLSQPRLNRYLIACRNSKDRAQRLYRGNLRISQAFYPVVNLFEVILRNKIHSILSTHFGNPDWIITEKNGFMNDPSLSRSGFYLKNQLIKTENKIRRGRGTISAGKIISEQSFGFWASLFDAHHYSLLSGIVINCFPHKTASANRRIIGRKLKKIRTFRNRLYHNEPICFIGNTIDLQNATDIKIEIYDLLNWISSDAGNYVQIYDNIDSKIALVRGI